MLTDAFKKMERLFSNFDIISLYDNVVNRRNNKIPSVSQHFVLSNKKIPHSLLRRRYFVMYRPPVIIILVEKKKHTSPTVR